MNDGTLSVVWDSIKNYKYLKHLVVLSAILISAWLIFILFFSKGTLQVTTENGEGAVRISVVKLKDGKIEDGFKPITLEGRNVSKKLSPGNYKVSSALYENETEGAAKKAESFKEIKVSARKSTSLNLKVFDTKKANLGSSTVKPLLTGFNQDKLYLITEFGTVLLLNPADGTKQVVQYGSNALSGVIGYCGFNNGNAVIMDNKGAMYRATGSTAELLELPYQEGTLEEIDFSVLINNTTGWVCTDDNLSFLRLYRISSSFDVSSIGFEDKLSDLVYGNVQTGNNDELIFYDQVDIDSFDEEGGPSDTEKDVTIFNKDGSSKEFDVRSFLSGIAGVQDGKFCFYYIRSINCVNFGSGSAEEVLKLPDNLSINNIAMLDSEKVIYSYNKSVWLLDLESGASSQIYESDHSIIPYSMVYDSSSNKLAFSAERGASDQVPTSYVTPLIDFSKSGL
jgi:hypothetical protein